MVAWGWEEAEELARGAQRDFGGGVQYMFITLIDVAVSQECMYIHAFQIVFPCVYTLLYANSISVKLF